MTRRRVVLRAAVLAALAAGCGTVRLYRGPRPREEIAVVRAAGAGEITGRPGEFRYEAWIVGVDGRKLYTRADVAEVLPGRHRFELEWERTEVPSREDYRLVHRQWWVKAAEGRLELELDAEAGRTYLLDWRLDGKEFDPRFREER
ncbi:MAG: hypothetical protein ACE5JG_02970 [Planctomycetota bacterium]